MQGDSKRQHCLALVMVVVVGRGWGMMNVDLILVAWRRPRDGREDGEHRHRLVLVMVVVVVGRGWGMMNVDLVSVAWRRPRDGQEDSER